jgi:hypothetical protein
MPRTSGLPGHPPRIEVTVYDLLTIPTSPLIPRQKIPWTENGVSFLFPISFHFATTFTLASRYIPFSLIPFLPLMIVIFDGIVSGFAPPLVASCMVLRRRVKAFHFISVVTSRLMVLTDNMVFHFAFLFSNTKAVFRCVLGTLWPLKPVQRRRMSCLATAPTMDNSSQHSPCNTCLLASITVTAFSSNSKLSA